MPIFKSKELNEMMATLLEEGLDDIIDYTPAEIQVMIDKETNTGVLNHLFMLKILLPQVQLFKKLLWDDLNDMWNEDEYQEWDGNEKHRPKTIK